MWKSLENTRVHYSANTTNIMISKISIPVPYLKFIFFFPFYILFMGLAKKYGHPEMIMSTQSSENRLFSMYLCTNTLWVKQERTVEDEDTLFSLWFEISPEIVQEVSKYSWESFGVYNLKYESLKINTKLEN